MKLCILFHSFACDYSETFDNNYQENSFILIKTENFTASLVNTEFLKDNHVYENIDKKVSVSKNFDSHAATRTVQQKRFV